MYFCYSECFRCLLYEFSNKRYYDQITHKSYDKLLIYSFSSSYDKYSIVFVLV